jgi:hypothetical protein
MTTVTFIDRKDHIRGIDAGDKSSVMAREVDTLPQNAMTITSTRRAIACRSGRPEAGR